MKGTNRSILIPARVKMIRLVEQGYTIQHVINHLHYISNYLSRLQSIPKWQYQLPSRFFEDTEKREELDLKSHEGNQITSESLIQQKKNQFETSI
jgi:TPP-dependent 2-oxoacid decarboxylase